MIHKEFHEPIRSHPKEKRVKNMNEQINKYRCSINIEKVPTCPGKSCTLYIRLTELKRFVYWG